MALDNNKNLFQINPHSYLSLLRNIVVPSRGNPRITACLEVLDSQGIWGAVSLRIICQGKIRQKKLTVEGMCQCGSVEILDG